MKERESQFGEFTYPTLAVNIQCPACNTPDVFYEPEFMIENKISYTRFKFQCHSCKHEWLSKMKHEKDKKK